MSYMAGTALFLLSESNPSLNASLEQVGFRWRASRAARFILPLQGRPCVYLRYVSFLLCAEAILILDVEW